MNKNQKLSKRGISPLIATVLIIGLTIVLAALVITWVTKLSQDTIEDTESTAKVNLLCTSADYDSSVTVNGLDLKVKVKNNRADPLSGAYFVVGSSSYSTNNNVLRGTTGTVVRFVNADCAVTTTDCSIGAFSEKEFTLVGATASAPSTGVELDVRVIVDADGEKTVCENEKHIKA